MDIINERRSVRSFSDKLVEPEKIEQLLRAAMQAPSAANQQPWEFLVIQGREELESLAQIGDHAAPVASAAAAIILLANKALMRIPENWQQDMSAAAQNLLLKAAGLHLGTLWTGVAPLEERIRFLQERYSLPESVVPFCVIAVGYPSNENANRFIDRYKPERVHFNRYKANK